jgi:hypothetical protein
MIRRPQVLISILLLVSFALLQWVPYGHEHRKPAGGARVSWDSPRTEALARRACFDCHSNETRWPWYASIAPVSWRIQGHVDRGRRALDFTDFDPKREHTAEHAGEAAESVRRGDMPPQDYLLAHPRAQLSPAEKQDLVHGLTTTFAAFAKREGGE